MIKIDFEEGKTCFSPKSVGRSFGSKRKISDFDGESQDLLICWKIPQIDHQSSMSPFYRYKIQVVHLYFDTNPCSLKPD